MAHLLRTSSAAAGDRGWPPASATGSAGRAGRPRHRPSRRAAAAPPAPPSRLRVSGQPLGSGAPHSGWPRAAHHAQQSGRLSAGRSSARSDRHHVFGRRCAAWSAASRPPAALISASDAAPRSPRVSRSTACDAAAPRRAADRRRRNAAPAWWPGGDGSPDGRPGSASATIPPASPGGKLCPISVLRPGLMGVRAEQEARRVAVSRSTSR